MDRDGGPQEPAKTCGSWRRRRDNCRTRGTRSGYPLWPDTVGVTGSGKIQLTDLWQRIVDFASQSLIMLAHASRDAAANAVEFAELEALVNLPAMRLYLPRALDATSSPPFVAEAVLEPLSKMPSPRSGSVGRAEGRYTRFGVPWSHDRFTRRSTNGHESR